MEQLIELYRSKFSAEPSVCAQLTGSASNRKYYRLSGDAGVCIGVIGTDLRENNAFVTIDNHFKSKGINVPEVYAVSQDGLSYIQEDLGDVVLFDMLTQARKAGEGMEHVEALLSRIASLRSS